MKLRNWSAIFLYPFLQLLDHLALEYNKPNTQQMK